MSSWRGDVVVVQKKGAPNVVSRRKRSCGGGLENGAATELPTWSEMDLVSGKVGRRSESGRENRRCERPMLRSSLEAVSEVTEPQDGRLGRRCGRCRMVVPRKRRGWKGDRR